MVNVFSFICNKKKFTYKKQNGAVDVGFPVIVAYFCLYY